MFLSRRMCLGAGSAKTKLTSLDVSRNCLGRQGAAALAAGLDEGQLWKLGSSACQDDGFS